ncbi:MAG: hypothetical protein JWL76_2373 [Thermoleophilia bacterium]|nr:hypothetical protein [Thermoleophilia bacterium]
MASTLQREQVQGREVFTADGDKVGTVEDIYYDTATNECEWVAVKAGFLGMKRMLVPIEGAQLHEDHLDLAYTKDQLSNAPDIDDTRLRSDDDEKVIYEHYGLEYPGASFGEYRGESVDGGGSVVRHEEELEVGKRTVETGRARLRKWVETEQVAEDVPLRRETAEVRREPIDQVVDGTIGDGEQVVEVELHAEEPVVSKQTVARERVSIDKDVETDVERVSDTVRNERVEVEREDDRY